MASASTSNAVNTATKSCYQIFLNHRGPDTKNTFASHLYRRLAVLHGFRVFWDKDEMRVGDTLTSQIHDAINTASVFVAIFSPRYAESKWCLDELHMMVESGKPIIPVFYHIQPAELRQTHGKGIYAQALHSLQKKRTYDSQPRYNSTTIENWRTALSTVAEISGLELNTFNGDEGELLDKVVDSVLQKLRKTRFDVAEHPTGLDEKIKDFEKKVLLVKRKHNGKPQVVGIVGLGGMGKTTLVKELFNRESSHYHKSCFVFDVRENARKASLESLQMKLLKGLTQIDENIGSVSEGIELLKTRLSCCHALVILDDVDHNDQLDALLRPIRDVVDSNSLILITSRDKDVLIRSKVEESSIYKLTGLNPQHSQELFCLHAFSQRHPFPGFEDLVNKYLKACNRLPLSLKVFGGLLYGNDDKSFWEGQLERLEQIILPKDIQKSLQISYEALQTDEQHIFLDIACFFIGKNMDTAIRIWDGCGWNGSLGFRSLQNKNLVEVDGWVDDFGRIKKEIRMHDHLRDLGRDLAKDPRLPRRIWRTEDFDDLLQQSSVVIEVRGISICWKANEYQSFPGCKMRNLQLLDIDSDFLTNYPLEAILNTVQSPNLVWLRWHNFLHSSPPSWIPMKKLRVLEAQVHKLETLWQEESQAPLQLRELQISSTTIRSLSDFFGNLTNLQDLNLSRCRKLQSLPYSFRNLTRLRYLDLSYCSKLTLSSEALGNICTLEHIDLTGCESIEVLPSQLVHQRSLETLNLWELKNLRELPLDTGKLRNLKNLNLWNCHRLKYLPDSLARLNGLTEFTINTCSLRQLSFIMVEGEGESICPNLQSLYITDCRALVEVGTLPNALTGLVLADCPELRKIEWQSPLSKLQMLNLSGCFKVEQLPSVETLVSLEQLDASRCVKLRSICGLAHLTKLQRLLVYGCSDLVELVGCEHLTLLKWLLVFGCPKLQLGEAVISRWIKVTWWRDYHFKWLHSAS